MTTAERNSASADVVPMPYLETTKGVFSDGCIQPQASQTLTLTKITSKVFHSFTDAEYLRNDWDTLVKESCADIYQTYDWCKIWWNYYGTCRNLHILSFFLEGKLVGILPAFTENIWLGLFHVKAAKLVGSDYTLHLCNVPIIVSYLNEIIEWSINYFFRNIGADLYLIGPLAGPNAHLDQLRLAGENLNLLVGSTEVLGSSCNTYFNFPSNFDLYLSCLPKKPRNNYTRSLSTLSKNHKVSFDVLSSPADTVKGFEEFHRIHEQQWLSASKLGHFGDWPHASSFNRELVNTLGNANRVRFHRIIANDHVISSQYCFVFGSTIYFRLPARLSGNEWDKFGLGSLSLVQKIKTSIEEGIKTGESGRGHYDYKVQFGGTESPLRTIQYTRNNHLSFARVSSFRRASRLLDIVYYKIIFARIAPRIPLLRKPLWSKWIRSSW